MNRQIGQLTNKVIDLLNLNYKKEMPIFIGDDNINHIKKQHLEDYNKYGTNIEDIIRNSRNSNFFLFLYFI